MSSTPTLTEFDPRVIPVQYQVIKDVRVNFDYSQGVQEVLLSGSIGSAKSLLIAHLAITHCLFYPKARVLIGRRTLRDLKRTLLNIILAHLGSDVTYQHNKSEGLIKFPQTGSEIVTASWDDGNYTKFRSYELSMAVIEELTENKEGEFYQEIYNRVGRLPHVPELLMISATNPDSPRHWAHERLIETKHKNRHVYYSKTEDNPFLPSHYLDNLRSTMDKKEAQRMLYGHWIEIRTEVIYHAYSDKNFSNTVYEVDQRYPINICWDFNIGEGKPLSGCMFQYIDDHFHFFDEFVISGARTLDSCEELASRGLLHYQVPCYYINGDATGAARTTKSIHSDYDIIRKFFDNYSYKVEIEGQGIDKRVNYVMQVPRSNPSVRDRHNKVNSYMCNDLEQNRLTVYAKCKTLDKGFRLTALKKGGSYVEDDSKAWQHVTTAAGYGICSTANTNRKKIINYRR